MIPLDINGKRQTVDLPGETPLLWTRRAAEAQAEAERDRDRRGHERQHLPLRDVHAYPRRHQAGGASAGRHAMNALVVANVSRRRFLQGISALGGLVLAVGYSSATRADDAKKC